MVTITSMHRFQESQLWIASGLSTCLHAAVLMFWTTRLHSTDVYGQSQFGMKTPLMTVTFLAADDGAVMPIHQPASAEAPVVDRKDPAEESTLTKVSETGFETDITAAPIEISKATVASAIAPLASHPAGGQPSVSDTVHQDTEASPGSPPATGVRWGNGGSGASGSPAYMRNPLPLYPRLALQRGWKGTTILHVEVRSDGHADRVEIWKSSGHEILDQAALEAVQKWCFLPAQRGYEAMTAWVEIPIDFRISSE